MRKVVLNEDQVRQLMENWSQAVAGSLEQRLIEDLFLITDTPSPLACQAAERG